MTHLIKTDKQLARDRRDQIIAAEYAAYRKANPDAPMARIVRTMAQDGKYNLSEPGIKRILYRTGAISPR